MPAPTPGELLSAAKRFLGNPPLDDPEILYRLLNDSLSFLWLAGPWPWTLTYSSVPLENDVYEYDAPSGLHIQQAILRDGDHVYQLSVVPVFGEPPSRGRPEQVCTPDSSTLRVSPKPYGYANPPVLEYWYKLNVPWVDSGNINDPFTAMPKDWLWVWEEILIAKAMEFVRDPRAGSFQVSSDGRFAANGQWGRVAQALQIMSQQTVTPRSPAGVFAVGAGK